MTSWEDRTWGIDKVVQEAPQIHELAFPWQMDWLKTQWSRSQWSPSVFQPTCYCRVHPTCCFLGFGSARWIPLLTELPLPTLPVQSTLGPHPGSQLIPSLFSCLSPLCSLTQNKKVGCQLRGSENLEGFAFVFSNSQMALGKSVCNKVQSHIDKGLSHWCVGQNL